MPKTKATPITLPSDELLLAAIDRAECHRGRDRSGVGLEIVKEHLGLKRGSWSTRQLRPQLDRLQTTGQIEQFRACGLVVWALTENGHRRLAAARRAQGIPRLPESPQHRVWREAHREAGERIEEFREDMRERLNAAISLLDAGDQTSSEAWRATGERLQYACQRLESATYCLHEWKEPDDSIADIEEPWHVGRRDTQRWDHH
jgi:hypothetical protein